MNQKRKRSQIALLMDMNEFYNRGVSVGVRKYFRAHTPCICEAIIPEEDNGWNWLLAGEWDGIVTYTFEESLVKFLAKHRIPTVNVSNALPPKFKTPRVVTDDYAVGQMAAEHFLQRGLRYFAYFGNEAYVSTLRQKGFGDALKKAGFEYDILSSDWQITKGRWIRVELPWIVARVGAGYWPLGVFCVSDSYARQVVGFCAAHDIRMPDQVAIVGVNNSEIADGLAEIPFTSIELQLENIGYKAMELLTSLMEGEKPPADPIMIPPKGVVVRLSSDLMAVNDEVIARALRMIRQDCLKPISIREIALAVGISRRLLEKRFHAATGRSPYAEVIRLRLEKAKLLLATTDMFVNEVAEASGFGQSKQMHVIFTREIGMGATAYRRQFRLHP